MKKVKFLDVGHADCSVIYFLNSNSIDKTIVIDIPKSDKLLDELDSNKCKCIDLIIISHSDSDHCKGFVDFTTKFIKGGGVIRALCFNHDRSIYDANCVKSLVRQSIKLSDNNNVENKMGTLPSDKQNELTLIDNGVESIKLIYPNPTENSKAASSSKKSLITNNMSLVCLSEGPNSQVLFTGDLESDGWIELLGRLRNLKSDIVKLPHHGSELDDAFSIEHVLDCINPHDVIISTRNNKKYSHPSEKTLTYLAKKGINVYCTEFTCLCEEITDNDLSCCGDIEVVDQASKYIIKTQKYRKTELSHPMCGSISNRQVSEHII